MQYVFFEKGIWSTIGSGAVCKVTFGEQGYFGEQDVLVAPPIILLRARFPHLWFLVYYLHRITPN